MADAFELGVNHVIVNIPFHHILGQGIDYQYDGKTYSFNKELLEVYDNTIRRMSEKNMTVTAVILNGWNDATRTDLSGRDEAAGDEGILLWVQCLYGGGIRDDQGDCLLPGRPLQQPVHPLRKGIQLDHRQRDQQTSSGTTWGR